METQGTLAEMSVAGSVLIDSEAYRLVAEIIAADDFQLGYCREIFTAAKQLSLAGETVDPVTIKRKAESNGMSITNEQIIQLMEITPTAANVVEYAKTVKEESVRRAIKSLCEEILMDGGSSADELLGRVSSGVDAIVGGRTRNGLVSCSDALVDLILDAEDYASGKKRALSTGFKGVDRAMGGGLYPGMLVIVGARPGMGKTTFALAIAENLAGQGKVLYVSLEMTRQQLAAKIVARHSGVPANKVLSGNMEDEEWDKVMNATGEVSKIPLSINRKMGATVEEIAVLAQSVKGLAAVVVDHLGLIRSTNARGHSRTEQITEISGALKQLALTLEVPIIALSQLNRMNEQRQNKRPSLADLRDSGSIEQDADVVMLLHRDDYYNSNEERKPWEPSLLEVDFAKTRFFGHTKVEFNVFLAKDIIREILRGHEDHK